MAEERGFVLRQLEHLAPLGGAEAWDNVGVLVDPGGVSSFCRALLTIDLDEAVLEEALEHGADLLISYHPPIFSGLKRLSFTVPHERIIVRIIQAGLTLYSPHTALDAVQPGMTDWLADALGSGTSRPIVPSAADSRTGAGRFVELQEPLDLDEAVQRIKEHLKIPFVRLSRAANGPRKIARFAVCPGAGGSVFEKLSDVDLLLTGEMRHHDTLGRKARGCHVVLTDHTNSERGYLPVFAARLREACPRLDVLVSSIDADPLLVV